MNRWECLLQGVILDGSKEALVERLRGICNELETPFRVRERMYKTPASPGTNSSELKVTCDLLEPVPTKRWGVKMIGQAAKTKYPTTIRTISEVKVSDSIEAFVESLGFKLDFEYLIEGTRSVALVSNRKFIITISKIKKKAENNNFVDIEEALATTNLVEIITHITSEEETASATEELNSLAERFAPIIDLAKLDPKNLPAPPPVKKTATTPIKQNPVLGSTIKF